MLITESSDYWCCAADFGQHEPTCENSIHAPHGIDDPFMSSKSEKKLDIAEGN